MMNMLIWINIDYKKKSKFIMMLNKKIEILIIRILYKLNNY